MKNKIKDGIKRFFLNTKIGKYILKSLAFLNTIEGVVHLIVSFVGAWGLIDTHTYDIRTWTPVVENFIFGIFSLITGWALGVHHD